MKNVALLLMSFLLILLVSCGEKDDPAPIDTDNLVDPVVEPEPDPSAMTGAMGTFTSFAHSLNGKAVIHTDDQGVKTLRLENFSMTKGPDVYVLFSTTNNYSQANTVAVAMLKEDYNNSNLSISINNSVDTETHKFVLIYCLQFSSLFGYAEMK